jgi:two-component system, LytTR family, response regulator
MKIRAIIVDDEKDIRFLLRKMLEEHFMEAVDIVGEAEDIAAAEVLIEREEPQLVFLDIRIKNKTGFDLLERCTNKDFEVIFITAYDQYAIKAFQFSAIGYLMKPIKLDELRKAIEKLTANLNRLKDDAGKRMKVLIDNYDGSGIRRICLASVEGFDVLELDKIVRLESDNNYTDFITSDGGRFTTSKTIKDYEDILAEFGFYRIHQRHIINLRQVKSYLRGDGGTIILNDGTELPLARMRKQGFLKRFL